jgi:hypothetical protein
VETSLETMLNNSVRSTHQMRGQLTHIAYAIITPAPPTPAIARPKIRIADTGATAQITEPTSKMTRAVMNAGFSEKYLKPFPQRRLQRHVANRLQSQSALEEPRDVGHQLNILCACIPADIVQRLEFICDIWGCRGYDTLILKVLMSANPSPS